MPLKADAGGSGSTLRRFLDEHLPCLDEVADEWADRLQRVRRPELPITQPGRDLMDVGTAFEIRVGLDMAIWPGYWRKLAVLSPEECTSLLLAAGFQRPPGQKGLEPATADPLLQSWERGERPTDDGTKQEAALRSCLKAAWGAFLTRTVVDPFGVEYHRSLLHHLRSRQMARDPGEEAPHRQDYELEMLGRLWRSYVRHGRSQIASLGDHVILEPEVARGYAIADLVVGQTLIEIKTEIAPWDWMELTVKQLVGYLLLDRSNQWELTSIALYSGWDAMLLKVPVDELLQRAAAAQTPKLSALRRDLHEAMAEELTEAEFYYVNERHPYWRAW